MKEPASLQQVERTCVLYQGRKLAYFAGCDYFRLASHPEILRAAANGMDKYGLNVAASRVTTGNHALYTELELALAKFFGAPAAVLVSNGYSTNLAAAQALRGQFTHVLIDAKAHVSLRDAALLFDCPILEFRNRDVADLRRAFSKAGGNAKPILLTDGVYTYEGEIAPAREYLKALGGRGTILLDDAHGAGIIGQAGRGTVEYEGVSRARVIQTVTLSKAFGVYGGAILCSAELRRKIVAGSSIFAGSTPLPLPLACAALRAIELVKTDVGLRCRLQHNVRYLKSGLRAAGYSTPMTPVPVAAITPGTPAETKRLEKRLLANGIFPSFIRYPGGPAGGYLRLVVSSEHTRAQLDALLAAVSP